MSADYEPDNLLDRLSDRGALERHYAHEEARERALLDRALGRHGGDALSVGAGWLPGRHLLPAPAWRLTAVDPDPNRPRYVVEAERADAGVVGRAGQLHDLADGSFDVVLYRHVLHHVVFQEPLGPVVAEAARLLRPGGALVAIEPNLWHPVGAALAAANRLGAGVRVHGTPDDVPLSPRALAADARAAGLAPEVHAVAFGWRRLPAAVQRRIEPLDRLGSRPVLRWLGHTFLLLARKTATR